MGVGAGAGDRFLIPVTQDVAQVQSDRRRARVPSARHLDVLRRGRGSVVGAVIARVDDRRGRGDPSVRRRPDRSALGARRSPPLPPSAGRADGRDDFALSRSQSFENFADTPYSHWKALQTHHAASFPNHYDDGKQTLTKYSNGVRDKGRAEQLRHSHRWYGRNFQEEFVCPLARRLSSDSTADGPKWSPRQKVCDPYRKAKQKDCLVYSVGSNGKAEFEKAVIEEIGLHCEMHTFDHVDKNKRNGDFATALRPYSTFHHWGFADEEAARKMPTKYKTLRGTMDELGHVGRTIDIFKIDCEWCEWFTWRKWLTVDMRQILVETHNAPMPNARDFFFGLHDAG
ncbi:hypothetical protein ACHAWF_015298 [Thalassiosira exigua]